MPRSNIQKPAYLRVKRKPVTLMSQVTRQMKPAEKRMVKIFFSELTPRTRDYVKLYTIQEIVEGIKKKGPKQFARDIELAFHF